MDILAVLGIIVATIVYLVLRPRSGQARESRGCAVAGLTALFFGLAFLILVAFMVVPPLSEWMDGLVGPGPTGDAFGFGWLALFFIIAGGISCLASLAIVLVLSFVLKARSNRAAHPTPGSRAGAGKRMADSFETRKE